MTTPVVVFPDAELVCVSYLRAQLAARGDTTAVGTVIPDPRPDSLVMARRLGGPRQTLVSDNAQIGIESWAPTAEAAHDRAQLCRALLLAMRGTTQQGAAVYRVGEIAGPGELPDPLSNQPRYVFSVEVALRGASA